MRVLKWAVPVDDQWHPVGDGPVLYVGAQSGPQVVQVWTLESDVPGPRVNRAVRVFGTGQNLPENIEYLGTALVGAFVWHVFETAPLRTKKG